MFDSVWEDIKREFRYGNVLTRLIIVNIGVFLAFNIAILACWLITGEGESKLVPILQPWLFASRVEHVIFVLVWANFERFCRQ